MYLNQPKNIPTPWSEEKLSSTKLIPDAKKIGDHCLKYVSCRQNINRIIKLICNLYVLIKASN